MPLDPALREELKTIVREVVVTELQEFAHCFIAESDKAFILLFEPVVTLLKTIDRNQNIVSETNDAVVRAVNSIQTAIIDKMDDPADDWKRGYTDED
jgi:hypothetical protein